jgi:hypothetical protein
MKIELLVGLVALGGTIFGSLVGAGVSVWITKEQLSLSFKQHKIEILQSEISRLQNDLDQISNVIIDVNDQNLTPDQIFSRMTDAFLQRTKFFLTFSYLFPKEFEEKVMSLNNELNQFIFNAKMHNPIDESKARSAVETIPIIEKEIFFLVRARLRKLQLELDKLTLTLDE